MLIYWQANGATIRLEINHIDFINKINYDGQVFSIEGCGSNPTYDQINQLPLTNLRNEKEICIPVGVSRDPNDKEVYPSGIGSNSLVDPDKYLEYTIQFQNTGTDTAFYISIYDTLSPYLNLATFQMISSSLSFNLQQFPNNILKWTF